MVRDANDGFDDRLENFIKLLGDTKKSIYPSSRVTKLVILVKLYHLKANSGWSHKSFTNSLALLNEILLDDNEMSDFLYEAKKILCTLGMGYENIHAYPNDCILYHKEYVDTSLYPICKLLDRRSTRDTKKREYGYLQRYYGISVNTMI